MEDSQADRAGALLRVLADLSPSTEPRSTGITVPTEWFRWLPVSALRLFGPHMEMDSEGRAPFPQRFFGEQSPEIRAVPIDRTFGERLAAVDQLRPGQRSLRVGWLFVAGRVPAEDGQYRRVFHPLVTVPVRVLRAPAIGNARLVPAGDVELTALATDRDQRQDLESRIELGGGALIGEEVEIAPALLARLDRLRNFAQSVAHAAGLPAAKLVPATDGPDALMRGESVAIVAGVGVFAIHEAGESSRASSLRAWSTGRLDRWTAFHSLYLAPPESGGGRSESGQLVESPYLLTPVQRRAVATSRSEPVTLISGGPGTGKSHTIAAIACDALANGERVLVAAKSDASVDAWLDLLERAPGPDPVVFGSNERREALANRLSAGQLRPVAAAEVARAGQEFETSAADREAIYDQVAARLGAEELLGESGAVTSGARVVAPGLFEPGADLERADSLIRGVTSSGDRWWDRRRRRQAQRELTERSRASPAATLEQIGNALELARATRAAVALQVDGGLELGLLWDQLRVADDKARDARGKWLAATSRSEQHLNSSTLSAVAALATALRSGRAARRAQLSRLNDDKLTRALPLWVGTLADVDDLLPPVAGLFDLVILDEASSIDQPLAATALLRGRRAVIAGDPQQLRQVSFVSDAQLQSATTSHGLDDDPVLAARLDVRRNSTFDLAAGAAPVQVLDEHFRCDPHLVDFVARRLYGGRLKIATRSPRTESRDCIDVVRVDGRRDKNGVVAAEVARAVTELKTRHRAGDRSVGVVTPFRAQADALEEAVLEAFTADEIEALDLRVGTAHAFQGNERDVVVVSLGIGTDDGAASWRFLEDPHLFAVLMTRARRRMLILVSADPPDGGLVAGFLAQADCPPGPPAPVCPVGPWAASLADALQGAGVPTFTAYPSGRHVVDLCAGDEHRNLDIECQVHPDGPAAHIDRHLALGRAGWEFAEAYPSRWGDRRGELIVELIARMKPTRP